MQTMQAGNRRVDCRSEAVRVNTEAYQRRPLVTVMTHSLHSSLEDHPNKSTFTLCW